MVLACFFIPSAVGAATILPESPRWLLLKKEIASAVAILKEVAATNEKPYPASAVFDDASPSPPHDAAGVQEKGSSDTSITTLFLHPELRFRQLIMMFGWFTCSMLFYGISIAGSGLTDNPYADFSWQAVAEVPGIVVAMYALDWHRTGRRGSLVIAFAESGVAMLLLMAFVSSSPATKTALAFGGKLGISAAFSIIYILPVELMPTGLRGGSMGLCSMFARVGGILAPFVVLLGSVSASLPFMVFAIPAGLSAFFTMMLPETRSKPLPQTVADIKTAPLSCCAPS